MCLADSRTWPGNPFAAYLSRHASRAALVGAAAAASAGGLSRDELARWLCGPCAPALSFDDMASVFGLCFDASDSDADGALATPASHRLRFTLAVLRDVFASDGAARRWLRAPNRECDGRRPLDLLLAGRVDQLEELAVGEWNRGRGAGA